MAQPRVLQRGPDCHGTQWGAITMRGQAGFFPQKCLHCRCTGRSYVRAAQPSPPWMALAAGRTRVGAPELPELQGGDPYA